MITLEELGAVLRKRGYPATPKDLDVLSKELWGDTKKGKGISKCHVKVCHCVIKRA